MIMIVDNLACRVVRLAASARVARDPMAVDRGLTGNGYRIQVTGLFWQRPAPTVKE